MKILFVSHSFPLPGNELANLGGMQRVAVELHEALAAHPEVRLRSRVLRSSWRWTAAKTVPFLAGTLAALLAGADGADVVLFSSMVTAALAPALAGPLGRAGVKMAAITHGLDVTDPNPLWRRWVPRTLASLDAVFPVSRATAEECVFRGAPRERVHPVPPGVDTRRFAAVADRAAARRQLLDGLGAAAAGIPADALLLASVGRPVARKGFRWFVEEVVPLLPPDAVYLLGGEGPETPALRAAVRERGLEDRVRVLGRLTEDELGRLYRGADLFLMPNVPVPGDMEGFGVVTLEAALCGLPTLAADLEGIRDAVAEGHTGHRIAAGDARAFADRITRYAADRDALARLSAGARGYVEGRFAWPRIADALVRHLAEPSVSRSSLCVSV